MTLTRHPLRDGEIEAVVRHAFGPGAEVARCGELTGGTFNAVHGVDLADGRRLVLKVAPPPSQPLLRYEHDLIRGEALWYRRAGVAGLPVPEVCFVDVSRAVLPQDYLFVTRVPGRPLNEAELPGGAEIAVRRELGGLMAAMHAAPGEWFGYPRADRHTRAARWSDSFATMVDDILADAVDWGVPVPDGIPALVDRHRAVLDEVTRPCLVHFDLWDGNAFVTDGDRPRVTGIIDGERCFYGDPLAEFVSMALFRDVDDVPAVLYGYAARSGTPVVLDGSARVRLALYSAYLYLLIIVEGPSRGFAGPDREALVTRVRELLDVQLGRL